jgi:hypothetical protein
MMLEWVSNPLLVAGKPRSHGAGVYPWTFVITFDGQRFAASVSDARELTLKHIFLGADFETLYEARAACITFLHRQPGCGQALSPPAEIGRQPRPGSRR